MRIIKTAKGSDLKSKYDRAMKRVAILDRIAFVTEKIWLHYEEKAFQQAVEFNRAKSAAKVAGSQLWDSYQKGIK